MKCLDCGYNIAPDEIREHEGHKIIEGFFEEEEIIKVTDVSIYAMGDTIKVHCPSCGGLNSYTVVTTSKETIIRSCKHCPAILAISYEKEEE